MARQASALSSVRSMTLLQHWLRSGLSADSLPLNLPQSVTLASFLRQS
jgi:hypothetical protein